MKNNLKALLFASAAVLSLSAVSMPAFADDLPHIGGGDIKTGGFPNDNRADSGKTADKINEDRDRINDNTKAAAAAQSTAEAAETAAGNAQSAAGKAQGDATNALAGVDANKDAIKQNSDAITGLSNIATQTTDYDKTVGATAVDKVARNSAAANADAIKQNSDAITGLSNIATQTTDYDKTVGATAVDKVARNRLDENDSMNEVQNAAIDKNTKGIAKNSERLDENDSMNKVQNAAIDKNTKGIKKAQSTADKAQADATTALTGGADDQTARNGVAANAQAIYQANQNIASTSAADRNYTDLTAAKTLASANAYTDSRYNQLNGKMNKLRARVDSGVAGATAIGTLAFDSLKANSVAGGLAVAKNKVAGAVGYQHNFNANWRARGTLAVSDNYVQGGASVGYSW